MIDVLVVAYHARERLADTLSSLALWSQPGYRLVVYDNSSKNYPLTWIWNRFFEQSNRPFVALCNPDIIVGPGWDVEAISCLEAIGHCAAVSPLTNSIFHKTIADIPEPGGDWRDKIPLITSNVRERFGASRFITTDDSRMV